MNLADLLDRPIAFQRSFFHLTKSINAALFLSQLNYWCVRCEREGGWIYKKQTEWEDETGLTRREQETARKTLRELGVLEEELRGIPATLYYRINYEILRTALAKTAKPPATNQPSQNGENSQSISSKNTAKNTTNIKASPKAKLFKKPSESEMKAFAKEIGLPEFEVGAFYDHHEARGWMLGRDKMKDWRAAMRTWKRNAEKFAKPVTIPVKKSSISDDSFWHGELEDLAREINEDGMPEPGYVKRKIEKCLRYTTEDKICEFLSYRLVETRYFEDIKLAFKNGRNE